jgi:hypothetical protein
MLRFSMPNRVPIGGKYFYVLPENQEYVESMERHDFVDRLRRAYSAAGLPMPVNIWELAEDYMCRMLPVGFCVGDDEGRPRFHTYTLQQVRENTTELIRTSDCTQSQAVAGSRAETCVTCPLHDRKSCTSCSGLSTWLERKIGRTLAGQNISSDWLGLCAVDGTMAGAKIFASNLKSNEKYPETCWMRRKGEVTVHD